MRTVATPVISILLVVLPAVFLTACSGPKPSGVSETPAPSPDSAPQAGDTGQEESAGLLADGATAPATPAVGDWLISRLPAEMAHLNPYTSTDVYSSDVNELVFDSLLDRDNETLEMIPHLAESWTISEDHLTYTFKLREGVTFTDGVPLTAADVRFSFATMTAPTTDAPHLRNYYRDVAACEQIDDYTIQFTCTKPYYRHIVMLGGMSIIPKHIYQEGDFNNHPNNRNPIGSGPYILERWDTGQQVVLRRNPDYWGVAIGKTPYFDKRLYKIILDDNAAFQVLNRGEMDVMSFRPEDWVNRAASAKFTERFNKIEYYRPSYYYIGWNSRRPQFDDKLVRRALTMLLDRELIRETIYLGYAKPVTGNFMPGTPENNPNVEPWPFDAAAAKALLDEQGWGDSDGDGIRDKDGVPFSFEMLIVNTSTTAEQTATIFQEELRRAGIDMHIRSLEWATMTQSVDERKFDAVMMGWSMPPDPDPFQVWHSSQADAGSNFVGFRNAEADSIIEQARVAFDRPTRIKLYNRFHEIVHEEQPYTFLFCTKALLAVDRRVHGIKIYPYGPDSSEWFVPEELQRYP